MKIKLFICFILIFKVAYSQSNTLKVGIERITRWHFMTVNFQHEFKNKFEVNIGAGFNITQVFNENYFTSKLFIEPLAEKFTDRFSLQYGVKRYFDIKNLPTKWFINYNQMIGKNKFIYKSYYYVDGKPYYQIDITDKGVLFNQNINIGIKTPLGDKWDLFSSIGLNHIVNQFIPSNPIKMRFDISFCYNFHKKAQL